MFKVNVLLNMGFYYTCKKIFRLINISKLGICIVIGSCIVLFILDFLESNDKYELRKEYFGRQNEKWRFGKTNDGQQEDDVMPFAIKTKSGYFHALSAKELNEGLVATLESQQTVLILTLQKIDKLSLIKNFLCSSKSYDLFPICSRIFYYHMCTFDDDSSRDVVMFIKRFAEHIFAISNEIGQEMYLNSDVSGYLNGNLCSTNLAQCVYHLVREPLQKISIVFPKKIFVIAVNFVDNCTRTSDNIKIDIINLLRFLQTKISSQFKFILITGQMFKMNGPEMYSRFGTSSYFDTYKLTMGLTKITRQKGSMFDGSDMRIGYSKDSVECLLILILLSCLQFVQLHKLYHHPLTIVIIAFYVKKVVFCGILVCSLVSLFILYLRYNLAKLKPLFEHKNWFYRLNLLCDNFDVHCIVDQRLEQKYNNLNSLYNKKASVDHLIVNETTPVAIEEFNLESMTEFEQLYRLKTTTKFNENQSFLRRSLVNASESKLSILCRWLLINIRNKGVGNKDIEKAMDIALKNLDRFTARAVSWCITKTFYQTFQVYLGNAYEVYPGLRCECHAKGNTTIPLCSKQKLIIILTEHQLAGLPQRYKGFKIEVHDINGINSTSEGMKLANQLSKNDRSSLLKLNISKEKAESLFYRHTNLSLICASVHRSISFQKKHIVKAEICIQFYCKRKGILPLGEQHFPDSIHGIPTDVIEGKAIMLSKLHVGDKIGPPTSTGTLGGFVKYLGFDCFLTCAHVMYDLQTLLSSSADFALLPGAKAYSHMTQGLVDCGTVIWRAFDHDDKLKTSIDAALVLLQNATIDPNDYIQDCMGNPCPYSQLGLNTPYLNSSCLDHEEFCIAHQTTSVVGAGANTKLECAVTFPRQSDIDILFSNTGQTAANVNSNVFQPLWISTSAHMQLSSGYLTDKRIFRMYNQMVINLGLKPGDSGTCIYVVQHPQNKNGCIGMAIAFCAGLTIVTPLKDILKRINTS